MTRGGANSDWGLIAAAIIVGSMVFASHAAKPDASQEREGVTQVSGQRAAQFEGSDIQPGKGLPVSRQGRQTLFAKTLRRPVESRTDTAGWRPFRPVEGPLSNAFDASDLLDPPAGRHGFLQVQRGRFAFEDGTPIRFFGVTIQGAQALPTHDEAERLAERLAQLGCNIVRLHHLDAPWAEPNIFDPTVDDTQHLSTESLDRLDYFIAQLKARGISVYLDLLVSRKFKAGDHVPGYRRLEPGVKVVAQYSPRLIQLQKQYARDLLTHENPYTKTRLVDEPAVVLIELINESSLFTLPERLESLPPFSLDELSMLWTEYLAGRGLAESRADPEGYLDIDDPLVQEFYASLQLRYFDELSDYLRGLGLKIPIAGSNLSVEGWDLLTNASLDFIDRHTYWDHPKGGFGDFVKFHNQSIIEVVQRHNPLVKLSRQRVSGKPFVVSEWNIAWPNEYRAAGPMLMAAYASFQGWDGLIQFNYQGELMPTRIEGNFDVSTKPELFLQFPVAARLFHRQDVAPARVWQAYPILPEDEIPPPLALLHGIERLVGDRAPRSRVDLRAPWISDTGELGWDARQGVVLIETARTQAAIGRMGDVPIELRDVTFEVTTPFACLILTSLDDQPLESSRHLLLTAVARSENTGTVYNAKRTILRDSGTSPILMERIVGLASLPMGERSAPAVFALDASGSRVAEIPVRVSDGVVEVPLGEVHAYEILFVEPS